MTRTGHKRQRLVDCNIVFVRRSDKSPMPVRPMPSAVQARRVRIRARPRGIATAAMPKVFLIVEPPQAVSLLRLLFPRQRLNVLDPRLRQRDARAAVPSIAINFTVGTERCSARHPALSR